MVADERFGGFTMMFAGSFVFLIIMAGSCYQGPGSRLSNSESVPPLISPTPPPNNNEEAELDALRVNVRLWNSLKIDKYTMTISQDAHGATRSKQTAIIEVTGENVNIRSAKQDDLRSLEHFSEVNTIPKIFNQIEKLEGEGWDVRADFDKRQGYPKIIRARDPRSNGWWALEVLKLDSQ